ncbi:MAG: hypothetical protein M0Q91_14235 [Methanoregula sp.]|nr:hypothetical protein [Methanoregula sp.]
MPVITVSDLSAGSSNSSCQDAVTKTRQLLAYLQIIELTETIAWEGGKHFATLSQKKGDQI